MTLYWVLLFMAGVGVAWYAGYRIHPLTNKPKREGLHRDYLVGLNFLLNEETDKAVDVFIKMLEVDSDTVETHLAVGNLFRRKGEVDRAIRIHQNLIARPQLDKFNREQALFELGQDYLSAGMIDRAERIYLELIQENPHSSRALKNLLDIYQQAKDWKNAIEIAQKYQSASGENMQPVIAHYYCEIAENRYQQKRFEKACEYLSLAERADKRCARASLQHAKVLIAQEDDKSALRYLKKIKEQNPAFLAESIDLLATCYLRLQREKDLVVYLKKLADDYPRVPVVLILAERIRQWKGDKVAAGFVADYVRRYPSLSGIALFINLYISNAEGRAKEDLHILQNLMKKVLANKPDYRCTSCGFSGKTLHWQCPGCKGWSTILPIHYLEEGFA